MSELRGLVFIGAGQMAEAIVRGVLDAGLITPDRVTMTDVRPQRLAQLRALGIRGESDNRVAVTHGDVIVLAVKPQDVTTVLADIGPHVGTDHPAAGVAGYAGVENAPSHNGGQLSLATGEPTGCGHSPEERSTVPGKCVACISARANRLAATAARRCQECQQPLDPAIGEDVHPNCQEAAA